jgi:hypothetical protein
MTLLSPSSEWESSCDALLLNRWIVTLRMNLLPLFLIEEMRFDRILSRIFFFFACENALTESIYLVFELGCSVPALLYVGLQLS